MLELGKVGQWRVMGWTRQSDNSGVGNTLYLGTSRIRAIYALIKNSHAFDRISMDMYNRSWPYE